MKLSLIVTIEANDPIPVSEATIEVAGYCIELSKNHPVQINVEVEQDVP